MKKVFQICGRDETKTEIVSALVVRPAVTELIKTHFRNGILKVLFAELTYGNFVMIIFSK